MAKATPWNAMLTKAARAVLTIPRYSPSRGREGLRSLRRVELLPRVFDLRNRLEFDIGETVALLLDAADIDILHHVARLRIDDDGSAGAVGVLPVAEKRHGLVAVDLAVHRFDDGEDRGHAVPAADRHETGRRLLTIFALPCRHIGLVRRTVAGIRIGPGCDHAQRLLAHARQLLVRNDVLRADDLDPVALHVEVVIGLHHRRRLLPRRHEDEDGVGLGILDALHERDEVGVFEWEAHHIDDLAAGVGE